MPHAQAGEILRHIRTLVGTETAADLSSAGLVQRFAVDRQEGAFNTLVQRYGLLVWGVCRRLLRREQDAEDAFQATFFVLAQRAASIWKGSR